MDSCLSDQIIEKYPWLSWLGRALGACEKVAVRRANLLLPVCPYLAQKARDLGARGPVTLLSDIAIESTPTGQTENIRARCGNPQLLALYVGNLEHYQGIDLLLHTCALLPANRSLALAIIGGSPTAIEHYRELAQRLQITAQVHFLGPRPLADLPLYLQQADILISPRLKGNNTPLKIYSYMLAGRPILATAINSHTQVLDATCASLAAPVPTAMAEALTTLAGDCQLREHLGHAARERALARHTRAVYERTLLQAYAEL